MEVAALEIAQSSKTQIARLRAAFENLTRDPRVRTAYGVTGHSAGLVIFADVPNWQEAERLASLARVHGLSDVEVFPLVPSENLRIGLEEAERIAVQRPEEPTPLKVGATT